LSSAPMALASNASPGTVAYAELRKWTLDSRSVITYCMSAQETLSNYFSSGEGDDKLVKIDRYRRGYTVAVGLRRVRYITRVVPNTLHLNLWIEAR
jgi:hypothetical protein